ncbi:hypothetical protein AB0424_01355 [Streptomyces sp. NPDC051180]|uniref:hypothetical protein n=1 Tax=Streptomyces sp. NPDC051180 TaxID=3155797 RepID=UPI00344B8868
MDVEKVTDELYGLTPAAFTAARDAYASRARKEKDAAGAKAIAALRRPALAAWAANLLARQRPREKEEFLALGESLREAHRTLDAERLRTEGSRQHRLVAALARMAADLAREAGQPVGGTVAHEVEQILHGVLADPEVAALWAKGRLVKPPAAAVGFPAVAPEAMAARPTAGREEGGSEAAVGGAAPRTSRTRGEGSSGRRGAGTSGKRGGEAARSPSPEASGKAGRDASEAAARETAQRARDLAHARTEAEEAAEDADGRERELRAARDARQAAAGRAEETAGRARQLEEELRDARRTAREAATAAGEARTAVTAAERALRSARAVASRAARAVERLER